MKTEMPKPPIRIKKKKQNKTKNTIPWRSASKPTELASVTVGSGTNITTFFEKSIGEVGSSTVVLSWGKFCPQETFVTILGVGLLASSG